MKKVFYFLPILFAIACVPKETTETEVLTETLIKEVPIQDSVLRHVVLFGFKESATPEQIQEIVEAFKALKTQIPEIKGFEWGINSSPEGLNQGLTHAFTLTFHSDADRDAYLPHPDHKAFGEKLGPILDKVTVVDYWTKK
ncbi:Dabb family protein [Algoriphagus mannitolivorans]|uniref:Dabb family protein n=1 Tax=Algoriphagus mannitolivorans TaxID=226504 RepID=UPI0003FA314E|nr:Dabb family protein [Algoriphagus mannitolivorans]